MIEIRRFERIDEKIACNSYIKHEDMPEKIEIFNYGFKHIRTDNIDK